MANIEIVNVVGWISYQQELDLAELAETLSHREEITEVKYDPAKNPWDRASSQTQPVHPRPVLG